MKLKDLINEKKELKPGTKVLYIKNRVLTPAKIINKVKKGKDWYWIEDNAGHKEVLKWENKTKPNKSFELVKH